MQAGQSVLVVGGQYGDEGKGKIVDLLVQQKSIQAVVRYNGGANAGHTIVLDSGKIPLHLIPSGILHPEVTNIIAAGVAVDPLFMVSELAGLRARGLSCENLIVSDRAHMVMPWHRAIDAHLGGQLGTTARGIGPCYEDRASRRGIRIGDLVDAQGKLETDHFSRRVREVCADKNLLMERVYDLPALDAENIIEEFLEAATIFAHQVRETGYEIAKLLSQGKAFLYEGAQGSLLDIDWGTYPYVTSSSVGLAGCLVGTGNHVQPEIRLGVVKAYTSRVGEGPFVAELGAYEKIKVEDRVEPGRQLPLLTDDQKKLALGGDDYLMGRWLRAVGAEFGTTTGRPRRCGWLDLVAVKHSVRTSGLNSLAVTKLDVLSDIPTLKVCVAYEINGVRTEEVPSRTRMLHHVTPVYLELPGWGSLEGVKSYNELPENCLRYLKVMEEHSGARVRIASIGSHRDQSLLREM
jgi:adenylosuccinate synthase